MSFMLMLFLTMIFYVDFTVEVLCSASNQSRSNKST